MFLTEPEYGDGGVVLRRAMSGYECADYLGLETPDERGAFLDAMAQSVSRRNGCRMATTPRQHARQVPSNADPAATV